MRKIRLIPRLDLKGKKFIKGIQFEGRRVIGDPNQFAKDYFNGGGHKNAAGGSLEDKLSVALDKFLDSVSKCSNELNY